MSELQLTKKIKAMENNLNAFTRVQGDKENITVVKQMPKVIFSKLPPPPKKTHKKQKHNTKS